MTDEITPDTVGRLVHRLLMGKHTLSRAGLIALGSDVTPADILFALERAREAQGISATELGKAAGLSMNYYRTLAAQPDPTPRVATLAALCRALGIEVDRPPPPDTTEPKLSQPADSPAFAALAADVAALRRRVAELERLVLEVTSKNDAKLSEVVRVAQTLAPYFWDYDVENFLSLDLPTSQAVTTLQGLLRLVPLPARTRMGHVLSVIRGAGKAARSESIKRLPALLDTSWPAKRLHDEILRHRHTAGLGQSLGAWRMMSPSSLGPDIELQRNLSFIDYPEASLGTIGDWLSMAHPSLLSVPLAALERPNPSSSVFACPEAWQWEPADGRLVVGPRAPWVLEEIRLTFDVVPDDIRKIWVAAERRNPLHRLERHLHKTSSSLAWVCRTSIVVGGFEALGLQVSGGGASRIRVALRARAATQRELSGRPLSPA